MGRPPIGKAAMSGAERTRRYRFKHGTDKPVTKVTKPDTGPLEAHIRELEARLADRDAELARERKLRAAAEAKGDKAALPPTEQARVAELEQKLADANKIVADYAAVYAEAKAMMNAKAPIPHDIYKTVLHSAHPDRVSTSDAKTKRRYQQAFQFLVEHERSLAKKPPKPRPPEFTWPRTPQEWAEEKWRVKEERAAKRAAKKAAKANPPKTLSRPRS